MSLSLPSLVVSDPGCQKNWEAVQSANITALQAEADATQAAQATTATTVAAHTARLALLGTSREAISSAAQGPGGVGVNLIYTPISVSLAAGLWLVYAQATVASSVADGKQLALWDGTVEIPNSAGAVEGAAAAGAEALLTTTALLSLAVTTTVQMVAKRNGASALTIGFSGATLTSEQRITAVRLI